MNRNIVQQILNGSTSPNKQTYFSNKSNRKPLLQQTLPKYRNQILQKQLIKIERQHKSSQVKQKYRNFGEDDFIKKLKYNSTKQIDKKSAKTIQKYLNQLGVQKLNNQNSLRRTHSLQYLSQMYPQMVKYNQEIESMPNKLNMKRNSNFIVEERFLGSNQSIHFDENKTIVSKTAKSAEIIKVKGQQKYQHLNCESQSAINNKKEFLGNKNEKNKQIIKQNFNIHINNNNKTSKASSHPPYFQSVSFRNPSLKVSEQNIQSQNQVQAEIRLFDRNSLLHQQQTAYQNQPSYNYNQNYNKFDSIRLDRSQNNFYHKVLNKNLPNNERPTIDTEQKIQYPSTPVNNQQKINQQFVKYRKIDEHKGVEKQLIQLRQMNLQQTEIIKLQQIMIQKLNSQLEIALNKLERLHVSGRLKNYQGIHIDLTEGFDNKGQSLPIKQLSLKLKQDQIQMNQLFQQQNFQYEANLDKLQSLLLSMKFSPQQQYSNNDLQLSSNNYQDHQNQSQQAQIQQPYLQSINEFYHKNNNDIKYENRKQKAKSKFNYFQFKDENRRNNQGNYLNNKHYSQMQQQQGDYYEQKESSFRDIQAAFMQEEEIQSK